MSASSKIIQEKEKKIAYHYFTSTPSIKSLSAEGCSFSIFSCLHHLGNKSLPHINHLGKSGPILKPDKLLMLCWLEKRLSCSLKRRQHAMMAQVFLCFDPFYPRSELFGTQYTFFSFTFVGLCLHGI